MGDDRIDLQRLDRIVCGEHTDADGPVGVSHAATVHRALADAMRTIDDRPAAEPPQFDATRALRRVEEQLGIASGVPRH